MSNTTKRATMEDPFMIPDDPNPILGIFIDKNNKGGADSHFTIHPKDKTGKYIYPVPQTLIFPNGKKTCYTGDELRLCEFATQMLPNVVKRIDTIIDNKLEKQKKLANLKHKLKGGVDITDEEKDMLSEIIK